MRCALVELNPFHRETLPTFVLLLNQLGVTVDVFARGDTLSRRPFAPCPSLRYKAHSIDDLPMKLWFELRRLAGYDFVVANSVEPVWILRKLARFQVPIIGVVHNSVLMLEDPEYQAFFSPASRRPLVLAPHIASWLGGRAAVSWVAPVHVTEDLRLDTARNDWLCVQGTIDFRRRNYGSLIVAASELEAAGVPSFSAIVVGKDSHLDGMRFRREVARRGLEKIIVLDGEKFGYDDYLEAVMTAAFILPLVDSTSLLFQPYFGEKVTSSLSMALATARIPVVHAAIARLYGIEGMAVTYEDGGLCDAIRRAMALPTDERGEMISGLRECRASLLRNSLSNLRAVMEDLALDPRRR